MTAIKQSRPSTTILATLAIAISVGLVGCSTHPTPSGASATGQASSSVVARARVDVSAVWATHPMPDCPRVVIGSASAPAGLELPSDETVAKQLAGVKSPAPEEWVRKKLGWVTKWLGKTRADIISDPSSPGVPAQSKRFGLYVEHIKSELTAGQDISDSALDGRFPEGCA